ncbi:hypothetical protein HaLaN_20451 [Haematococcus lacustris]|uniref:Uncharacterized protein n=1 Tax=Haematococcus lacustris TaxID=44745 RepID=A0A699ZXB3_HAELA|nr:hypothetical protein HaLaN_20451 [Haematococcus lacustris]
MAHTSSQCDAGGTAYQAAAPPLYLFQYSVSVVNDAMNGLVPYDGTSDETGSDTGSDGSCARKRPKVEDNKIAVGYATARQGNNTALSTHGRRQASSRFCTSAGPAHVEPQVPAHSLLAQPAEKVSTEPSWGTLKVNMSPLVTYAALQPGMTAGGMGQRRSQGRVRTFPHVEGVYPTLVMVPAEHRGAGGLSPGAGRHAAAAA